LGVTTHANACGAATTWVVLTSTFWFFSQPFFFSLFVGSHTAEHWIDFDDLLTYFWARRCLLGVALILLPLWGQIFKKHLEANTHFW